MTQSRDLAPIEGVVAEIQHPAFLEQIRQSLPENVTPERFTRVAITTLRATPQLLQCDRTSLFAAIVKCAQDGLLPDGREAAIVKRGQYASYNPMIGGFRKVAGEHGWSLRTAVVYENDEFRHEVLDGEEIIRHAPVRPGAERGDLIAAYAISKHRDGRRMQIVLHPDDIAKRRALAQTDNVWNQWTAQMWEKSAGRALFKQLPFAESDKRAISMLAADVAPDDAARQLYGGSAVETPAALPPASTTDDGTNRTSSGMTTSPPPQAEPTAVVDQQAGSAAATPVQTPAAAAPVPGGDEEIVAAAKEAAKLVPPSGVHASAGRSLAQIHALGADGTRWFGMALRKQDLHETFRTALFNYARVYLPELFDQVIAENEAQL